jgi:hypothetical protein
MIVQYKEVFLRQYIFHIKLWNKILKPNDNIHFRQNILYNKNLNVKLSNQTCVPDFDQHLITFKFTNLTKLIKIWFLWDLFLFFSLFFYLANHYDLTTSCIGSNHVNFVYHSESFYFFKKHVCYSIQNRLILQTCHWLVVCKLTRYGMLLV